MTGSSFPSSTTTLQKPVFHSDVFVMEKRSIDLNQHAFDLNEVPLNDSNASFSDIPAPDEVRNLWLPKKGGWLELFCKMFGQESLVMNVPITNFAGAGSGVFNANHNGMRTDAMNCSDRTPQCEQGTRRKRGKRKMSEASWNINADASLNGKCNKTENRLSFDGAQVPSIFHVPCLPLEEQGNLHNGCLQKSGSNLTSSHNFRTCSSVGQAHNYPFHTEREQGNTETLRNGFDHNVSSLPVLDLNSLPCSVSNVNFQSPLQQVNPPPNEFFQSFSRGTPQSIKVCQSFYSVNDLGETPDDENKNKQKSSRGFLKKGSEQRVRKDHSVASEGGKDFELINHEPSSADFVELEGQEPRIRIIDSPDWLPEGWITELKTRKAGSTAGTTDKYYKDPVSGRRFRSKNEVMNYLLTGNICRYKLQSKSFEGMIPFLNGFQPLETEQTPGSSANEVNPSVRDCPEDIFPGKISVVKEGEEEIVHNSVLLQNAFLPLSKGKVHNHSSSTNSKHQTVENKIMQATSMPLFLEEPGGTISTAVAEKFDTRVSCCSFSESAAGVEQNSTDGQTKLKESLLSSFGVNQNSEIIDCNSNIVITGHNHHHHHRHHHYRHQQKGLLNKLIGRKVLKLTLKHERELLISLGRKLCQEFLAASGTVTTPH